MEYPRVGLARWQLAPMLHLCAPLLIRSVFPGPTTERYSFDSGIIRRTDRFNVRIFFEGIVNNTTVIRVHRIQVIRTSRLPYQVPDFLHSGQQTVVTHLSEMFNVEVNFGSSLILRLKDSIQKKLNVFQCRSVAANQPIAFRGIDLYHKPLFVLRHLVFTNKPEISKHSVEDFYRVLFHTMTDVGGLTSFSFSSSRSTIHYQTKPLSLGRAAPCSA